MNLAVRLGKCDLTSPLLGASGLFGYGTEYGEILDYGSFGAIITKTITPEPRQGNPPPRMVDLGWGLVNSIGLENIGCEAFLRECLPKLADLECKLFVSVGGATVDEYRRLAGRLEACPAIDGLEVNISCPNVAKGGLAFGIDAETTRQVLSGVKSETGLTVLAKLPPMISGLDEVCQAASQVGADALTLANTCPAMAIDIESQSPVLGALTGGLSGPAIKPISLLLVWKMAQVVEVPIVAAGGIETAQDAIEFILAGATAFQVGSVILKDVKAPVRIMEGLIAYMKTKGYRDIQEFRGNATR